MQYLELSEDGSYSLSDDSYSLSDNSAYSLSDGAYSLAEVNLDNYLFVPDEDGGKWVNVSYFAGTSREKFDKILDALLPYQPNMDEPGMALFGLGKKAQKFKEEKQAAKIAKKAAQTSNIAAKAALKNAKAAGITSGAYKPGGGITDALKSVGATVGGIISGKKASDSGLDVSGGIKFDTDSDGEGGGAEPGFLEKYKTPLIILAVAVGGFVVYKVATKKK